MLLLLHKQGHCCCPAHAETANTAAAGAGITTATKNSTSKQQQQVPDRDCSLPGFYFKEGQLPLDRHHSDQSPVILLTLPYKPTRWLFKSQKPQPFESVAATAAACQANNACGMFTSSGYVVGAHRLKNDPHVRKKFDRRSDIIKWHTMHNCEGGSIGKHAHAGAPGGG